MGLFHRSDEDSDAPADGARAAAGGAAAGPATVADQVADVFDRISRLSLPERAAELLNSIAQALDQADEYLSMQSLLAPWLPDTDWPKWSPEQRATWFSLELVLQEAFQVLVLTRLLIRREAQFHGATDVTYALGPDGRAAQTRGDAAELVARRLPD